MACRAAAGHFGSARPGTAARRADGCFAVVLCCVAVANPYVCTPSSYGLYSHGRSNHFAGSLMPGHDAHITAVSTASPRGRLEAVAVGQAEYLEITSRSESSVLPLAVLWMREPPAPQYTNA
jgi:hypothetical protein